MRGLSKIKNGKKFIICNTDGKFRKMNPFEDLEIINELHSNPDHNPQVNLNCNPSPLLQY